MSRPLRRPSISGAAALLGLALAAAAGMPGAARRSVPAAQAVGSCPVGITVAGPRDFMIQPTVFPSRFPPRLGEYVQYAVESDAEALAALQSHDADVAVLTAPIRSGLGVNEWELAVGLFAVEYDFAVTRVANSKQVIADDWVNYMRSARGVQWLGALRYTGVPMSPVPPILDANVNLDPTVSLGDIGAVVANWGQQSSCAGWIRPDADNNGKASLGDIGMIAHWWGNDGLTCGPGGQLLSGQPAPAERFGWSISDDADWQRLAHSSAPEPCVPLWNP